MNVPSDTELDAYERGRMFEKVQEHDRRLQAINGSIDRGKIALDQVSKELANVKTEVAKIAVKVGIASGIAALLGSGITAIIVFVLTHNGGGSE